MEFIRKLFSQKYLLYWTILVCLLGDLFFFYSHGFLRESYNNLAYINFIDNFPHSIASTRVEPLFVVISVLLAKLIGSKLTSIIILKNLLIVLQLFVFYKISDLFLKNKYLSSLSVIFLNFSFAYFSLIDNLLRNSLGNLLFLISLYYIFKIFSTDKINKSNIIFASLSGGLVIYAHILPTVILDFGLIGIAFSLIFLVFFQKQEIFKIKMRNFYLNASVARSMFITVLLIFLIQSPYIIRMATEHAGIGDYKTTTNNQPVNRPTNTITQKVPIKIQPEAVAAKIFRIIFEYRLTGFSVFAIFLIFLSIIILLKKLSINSPQFPMLIFWLATYAGSKSDLLFGIGTLPYRFSLMLIFPSIILIFLLINELLKKIKNTEGKVFFALIMLASFLAINLPITAEASVLKNYNYQTGKDALLQNLYAKLSPDNKKMVFLINGDSPENIATQSTYLRNDSIFSTTNQNEITTFAKEHSLDYVIFDNNRINQQGNDIGSRINTNLASFEKSSYFENIGNYTDKDGINLTIFKFIPTGNAPQNMSGGYFSCSSDQNCVRDFSIALNNNHSPINNWDIEINQADEMSINEYARLANGNQVAISYAEPASKNDAFSESASIALKDIPARQSISPTVNSYVTSALFLFSSQNIDINYVNLEKFSINKLTISGTLEDNKIEYTTLTREGFRFFISILFFAALVVTYLMLILYRKIKLSKNNLFEFTSKTSAIIILGLAFFSIVDMLGGNMLFLEIYKKLIGA
ncbi:MAG: hypothetical protein P4L62_03565 [Candidatus Pacebacteria bacterium]|nr:hypothetical protein [Candidatus Paceibacterota bacterium]